MRNIVVTILADKDHPVFSGSQEIAVASSVARKAVRVSTVVGALRFVTNRPVGHDRESRVAVFEHVGKIPVFPSVVGGHEEVDLAQMLAKRPVLQEGFPAGFLQVAGEDDVDVAVVQERDKTKVVGVAEGRIAIVESGDLGTGEVKAAWLCDGAHTIQQRRSTWP